MSAAQDDPPSNVSRAREAIRLLDPERRALMELYYLEGFSVLEIARIFKIPIGTVKSRLSNARATLRAALEV